MKGVLSACVALGFVPSAIATPPFKPIEITRKNADSFDFVVTWDRLEEGRHLKILAPKTTLKVCTPGSYRLSLHDSSGVLVYDQKSTIGATYAGPEFAYTLYNESNYLFIQIFYACPKGYQLNGVVYEIDSRVLDTRPGK